MSPAKHETDWTAPGDLHASFLVATALIGLGMASDRWVLVLPLLFALGMRFPLGGKVVFRLGLVSYVLLMVPFGLLYRTWEITARLGIYDFSFAFYAALYLCTAAILELYAPPFDGRLPRILFCTALPFSAAGLELTSRVYAILTAVYVVDAVLVLRDSLRVRRGNRAKKRLHRLAIWTTFALVGVLTVGSVLLLETYLGRLNMLFLRALQQLPIPGSVGFSDAVRLGTVTDLRDSPQGRAIAVRVIAPRPPGYLRGQAYSTYGDGAWTHAFRTKDFKPDRGDEEARKRLGRHVLSGRPAPPDTARPAMTAYPARAYRAHFFLPLAACAVDTASRSVEESVDLTLRTKHVPTSRGYHVHLAAAPVHYPFPGPEEETPAETAFPPRTYLNVPPGEAMTRLLDEVIGRLEPRGRDRGALVDAVTTYFHQNYRYKLGVSLVPSVDPVYQFLSSKREGHCELFAAAGALLLRRMGVPCRYVTGFVCEEANPYGGDQWVARNKDAHAWVEYYDRELGWRIAEFTPGGGVPQPAPPTGWDAFFEYLDGLWERFTGLLLRQGAAGLLTLALEQVGRVGLWLIRPWWRGVLIGLALGLFFLHRAWQLRARARSALYGKRDFPQQIADLRERFRRLQKRLAREGLAKADGETLREYRVRLAARQFEEKREALALVEALADARYRPF